MVVKHPVHSPVHESTVQVLKYPRLQAFLALDSTLHCSIAAHSYVCIHFGLALLMQPQIFGPMVTALDRFYCSNL